MKNKHRVLDPAKAGQVQPNLCALAVMTKAPRAGQVKTRLTPPLSAVEAAELNACFLRDISAAISVTSAMGGARGVGVYTPEGAEADFAGILPPDFDLLLQRGEKLEERLISAATDLLRVGFTSVCLMNSDSPTVPATAFTQAISWLSAGNDRMVLGPSDDGGYYLIGFNRIRQRVFEEINWSTPQVCEQTLARAKEIGLAVKLLPTWYDVDDRATLRRLFEELHGDGAQGYPAPATRGFLETLDRAVIFG